MKRLKYAVILLLGLSMAIMASCTKDPNNGGNGGNNGGGGNTYAELIVGKWEATNTVHGYHSFSVYAGETFVFTADGLTTFPDGDAIPYEIEGSSLTLIGWGAKGGNTTFIIDELTSSTLIISDGYIEGQLVLKKKQ